ncbi:MAG: hypothetical protein A2Y17_08755 [Clostridiales bacterium GWF2_38_85]|nr:MAG: hypothetical protein A2Y17_08755 [Clostridiales bacterium GWF2_38_85]HBL83715.1 hypothetical protein [Clostridiales bacterium]
MKTILDISVAFFSVIGMISAAWWIIESIYRARQKGLTGTYLYIPAEKEDEEDAAKILGSIIDKKTKGFCGTILVLCTDNIDKDLVIDEFCEKFGRIYKYEAGCIEIRKCCDGFDNNRRND